MGRVVRFWMLRIEHSHAPVTPPTPTHSFPFHAPSQKPIRVMAQTIQRKQKRKQPAAAAATEHPDSTPPAPKRVKVSQAQTARKSTGGYEPPPRRPGRGRGRGGGGGGGGGGGDDGDDDDDGDGDGNGAPRAGPSRQRMWLHFPSCMRSPTCAGILTRFKMLLRFVLAQAEIPGRIAMRQPKSGGTDLARSPFARSGSTRRARTCSCAGFLLHASYVTSWPFFFFPLLSLSHRFDPRASSADCVK
jgi:hypothetical protein